MWKLIGKYALKVALYALQHKEEVKKLVDEIVAAKRGK